MIHYNIYYRTVLTDISLNDHECLYSKFQCFDYLAFVVMTEGVDNLVGPIIIHEIVNIAEIDNCI